MFEPGEVVRVTEVHSPDFNGVVEVVVMKKAALKVSVTYFRRSTPGELEFGQVKKAN